MDNVSSRTIHFWVNDLLGRAMLFTLYVTALCFLLYLLGSFQGFLDTTQFFLIGIVKVSALLFLFIAIFFIAGRIIEWCVNRKKHLFELILTLIGMILVALVYVFVEFIIVMTG